MFSIRSFVARVNAARPRAGVRIGRGSWVARTASLVGPGINLGKRVTLYRNVEILGPAVLDDRCFVNRDVYIRPYTTIGSQVNIGPFCRIISDAHEIGSSARRAGKQSFKPIRIGSGTWLGAAVTVLGGVTIGEGVVVAAGSVVTDDLPSNTLCAGVPAKVKRVLDHGEGAVRSDLVP